MGVVKFKAHRIKLISRLLRFFGEGNLKVLADYVSGQYKRIT